MQDADEQLQDAQDIPLKVEHDELQVLRHATIPVKQPDTDGI